MLKESLDENTGYGAWLKQNKAEGDIKNWLTEFLEKKKGGEVKIRVVHEVTKPCYSLSKLTLLFKHFFD